MFLCLADPDPLVRGTDPSPDPFIIKLLYDFLSLRNDVNVASKSNQQKIIFSCQAILKVTDENSRIWSRIRMR